MRIDQIKIDEWPQAGAGARGVLSPAFEGEKNEIVGWPMAE